MGKMENAKHDRVHNREIVAITGMLLWSNNCTPVGHGKAIVEEPRLLFCSARCSRIGAYVLSLRDLMMGANILDATIDTARATELIERFKILGPPSPDCPLPLVTLEEFFLETTTTGSI